MANGAKITLTENRVVSLEKIRNIGIIAYIDMVKRQTGGLIIPVGPTKLAILMKGQHKWIDGRRKSWDYSAYATTTFGATTGLILLTRPC